MRLAKLLHYKGMSLKHSIRFDVSMFNLGQASHRELKLGPDVTTIECRAIEKKSSEILDLQLSECRGNLTT